ncbi:MAG: efflux RND transporter periplasmic adaptor subunit, partial [Pseudomonadota bacterium]
ISPVVDVIRPTPTNQKLRVTETGVVRVRSEVSIAPQVGGRIIQTAPEFAAGGAFSAGQLLFVIDPTDFNLAVQQAKADLDSAESALELEVAEAETAQREWRLVNGDEPIPAMVARKPQISQAEANVAASAARLADAREDLSRTRYAFPFDGRVLSTTIERGQTVAANQAYGSVYNVETVESFVSIPLEALAILEPAVGRKARITPIGGGARQTFNAEVIRVEARLDDLTRLAGLVLAFESPPTLLPGAFVQVEVLGDAVDNVFVLPPDAVTASGDVWVVENGAMAIRRPRILSRQGDEVIVTAFDAANGVVSALPSGAREGLAVRVAGGADLVSGAE